MEGEVKFYLDKILVKVKEAEEKALTAIAHQIEGQAKVNIVANDQVDTGFMLNAIYVVTDDGSNYGQAKAQAEAKNPDAEMAPEVPAEEGKVAVVAGANYSIYQEAKQSFLYVAAEEVAGQVGGIVEKIGREVIKD